MTDDTWGISGPSFLALYLIAAVAAVAVAVKLRRDRARGTPDPGWEPGAEEIAYFLGGPAQAVLTAVGWLRATQAITVHLGGSLTTVGEPPAPASALAAGVYRAVQRSQVRVDRLRTHRFVQPVLDDIGDRLVARGWLLSGARRAAVRRAAVPVFAVLALGVARLVAGRAGGAPIRNLLLLTLVLLGIAGWLLLRVPKRARAAQDTVATLMARTRQPVGASAETAALTVAFVGGSALLEIDPAFAESLHPPRPSGSGSGGGDGGGSGGGDGGGSDGGDGGGCGGGCGGCGGCGG